VLLVLGDWDEAQKLIGLLPVEDSSVRLLRSELAFVRGDFDGSQAEAEMALIGSSAERVSALIRLADIALYLGDFSEAQRYGRSALDLASISDANLRARCYVIVAATEYFGGDIQAAGTRFREALDRPAHRLGPTPRPSRTTPASHDRDVPGHPPRPCRTGRGVRDRNVRIMGTGGRQPVHAPGGRHRRSAQGRPGDRHRRAACRDVDPGVRGNVGTARRRHQPGSVRDGGSSSVVRDPGHLPAQRAKPPFIRPPHTPNEYLRLSISTETL